MAENGSSGQRLGRGLAALIGDLAPVDAPRVAESGIRRLPLEFIRPNPLNPRKRFADDDLGELADSIREKGVMQPLLVRPVASEPDTFELIAGERRWRAAQKAGLHEAPVIVREVDDREALELAIIENVQRADLNPLEEAQGYQQLIDQFSYSQNELAQVIGKSRSHVANTLRLTKLPASVQALLAEGELTAGHARTLITAADPEALAARIVAGGLSVREAEALQGETASKAGKAPSRLEKDADMLDLERRLGEALGLKIAIQHGARGGKVEIRYKSLDQFDMILDRLEGRVKAG